jgi:hypothetical protein
MPTSASPMADLDPEKVAYWYFRLNGFLQIENFVVHPERRGSQRTDADLLGVRFRHRAEFMFDHRTPMVDDERLALTHRFDDVVIVEVKKNQPCTLNGPWTNPDRQNVHRVLAAVGCIPREYISEAAQCIYDDGVTIFGRTRIRLIAVGWNRSADLATRYPKVLQLIWCDIIGFVWDRFRAYREQKRHVEQWDDSGLFLRQLADETDRAAFILETGRRMGLRRQEGMGDSH